MGRAYHRSGHVGVHLDNQFLIYLHSYTPTEKTGPALVEDLSILSDCDPTGNGHTVGSLPVIGGSVSVLV